MCKNMTHAMKANKLLYNNGIQSRVEKISDDPNVRGCVYSIIFNDRYSKEAIEILRAGGVMLHKKEYDYYGENHV